jgi:hypothetical protein
VKYLKNISVITSDAKYLGCILEKTIGATNRPNENIPNITMEDKT